MPEKIWKSDLLDLTIKIDYDKCKGHSNCVQECPSDVFAIEDDKAICPGIDDCIECCACIDACPEGAIAHSSCED